MGSDRAALLAGLSAGCGAGISCLAFYPLELVKTKLQSEIAGSRDASDVVQDVIEKDGFLGLFKGISPVLCRSVLGDSLYFAISSNMIQTIQTRMCRKLTSIEAVCCGIVSACLTQLFVHPIDTICTKIITEQNSDTSFLMHARNIVNECGVSGLWAGYRASMILSLNPALQFTAFERLKERLVIALGKELGAGHLFLLGMISKACTLSIVYPLIRMKVRMQSDNAIPDMRSSFDQIMDAEGFQGLYKGWFSQIGKSTMSTALLLTTKEEIERNLERFIKRLT